MSDLDLLAEIDLPEEQVVVSLPRREFERLGIVMKRSPEVAIIELLRRSLPTRNGHQLFEGACSYCGLPAYLKRRPIPGRRIWCESCKASGEPGRQRALDFRARQKEKVQ